ncbi:hypothetical protein [Nocardioides sp. Iso805N]|uniref:hypothetical protein n=1 Tax=Nocardioides sp. Iso805N TaxID=1283287 RepID=UPI0003608151|nr:hypothetical protein [Nocardioides sp. Iso805N]
MSGDGASAKGDLIPDPGHLGPPTSWDTYGLGAAGIIVLVLGWTASSYLGGVARVICRVVAVVGGLYGVYLILICVGMTVLVRVLGHWADRMRRDEARASGEVLLELRFGRPGDEPPEFELTEPLTDELSGGGACGESTTTGGAVTCYLHGRELDHLVTSARAVAARYGLPSNAYLWVPSQARRGYGTRLPITTAS